MTETKGLNGASLAFFRSFFGLVMLGSYIRFWLKGWIESIYIEPSYHFKYYFFDWVHVPPSGVVYATFVVAGLLSLLFAVGLYPRIVALLLFVVFTYIELWERSLYLNHYYFISVMLLVMMWIPSAGYFSVKPSENQKVIDPKCYLAIKVLVSCVYFYAGIAKMNSDWLFDGEPLFTWLIPYRDLFTLDGLVSLRTTAIAMSWGGMVFDTTVWLFLFNKKTRIYAFIVAFIFHLIVGILFPIGIFPFVMVGAITIFFEPDWPLRLWGRLRGRFGECPEESPTGEPASFTLQRVGLTVVSAILALQLVIPLRSFFYPGFQNWNDDGFKFSWRVMLVEREGTVYYKLHHSDGRTDLINPREALTPQQYHLLAVTPDMIVKYGKHLASLPENDPTTITSVTVSSLIAYNGRLPRPYIDPEANLLTVSPFDFNDTFVLPEPK